MRDLVRKNSLSLARPRMIFARAKNNVRPHRVCARIYLACGFGCIGICMYAYRTEVIVESRLHQSTRFRIEWLSGGTHHLCHGGRKLRIPHGGTARWTFELPVHRFSGCSAGNSSSVPTGIAAVGSNLTKTLLFSSKMA